ncbi:lipid-binding SYLF domain-containing protein [Noviherbaspirillum cavernae]|nr:lipid-binding SYLF domain-containing protein [Noviherbaspirillum cavernae]
MLEINFRKFSLIAVCFSFLLAGCAATGTKEDATASVRAAEATLTNFQNDPEMRWMRDHLKDARAVLISPRILKAGFVFGGSGGSGVLLVRGEGGRSWAGPAFYRLATASVGFQAGVDSSEMVALVMSEKALNSLLSTSFKLGGEVSVSAGPVGMGAGAPVNADMIVFTRSKGLYGGLNVDGTVISIDTAGNESFYGKPVTPVDILVRKNVSSPNAASIQRTLAGSAGK